jgi:hypothetical protein
MYLIFVNGTESILSFANYDTAISGMVESVVALKIYVVVVGSKLIYESLDTWM